jgi:hypothetical protein
MFHVHCTQNGSGEVYFTSNTGNTNQNNDSPKLILAGEYQTAGVSLQAVNTAAYGRKDLVNQRCLDHMKDYVIPDDVDQEYDLTLQRDINTYGNIQWYYFSACIDESQLDTIAFPLKIRFNIVNMQKSDALYNYGMKPLMYSVKDSDSDSVDSNLGWVHGGYDICYYKNGLTEVKNANSSKKKKSDFDLLVTEIDPATLTLKVLTQSKAEIYSYSHGHLKLKKDDSYQLIKGEKVIVFSSGFIFNWIEGHPKNDLHDFVKKEENLSSGELMSELFFQLKEGKEGQFLKKDATLLLMEVNRHGIHKV